MPSAIRLYWEGRRSPLKFAKDQRLAVLQTKILQNMSNGQEFGVKEPFMTGFLKDNNYIGRPVDVEVMKDGALLVSDDYAGAIYRISYDGRRVAGR